MRRKAPILLSLIALAGMLWFAFRSRGSAESSQASRDQSQPEIAAQRAHEPPQRRSDATPKVIGPPKTSVGLDGKLRGTDEAAQLRKLAAAVDAHTAATVREALAINAENADKFVDKLCEKSRSLYAEGGVPARPQAGHRDAAQFTARMIDYEKPLDNPPGLLHLPREFVEQVESLGSAWPSKLNLKDAAVMDFYWLEQLGQFDRWSVLAAGPLRSYPPTNFLYEPLPNYRTRTMEFSLRDPDGYYVTISAP